MIALCDLEAFVPEVALFIPCPFRFTLFPSTRKPAPSGNRKEVNQPPYPLRFPFLITYIRRPGLNRT